MKSSWNDKEAEEFRHDPVKLRAYTSRLLGKEPSLVLHGGGNTSVKAQAKNVFGDNIDVLYVKGSGWDLATIEPQGFAPVRMDVLLRLAQLEKLSDTDMVREQKCAMLDPNAPGPSVEAILHAIIPFKFVEHTHADAVVALTNTPDGENLVKKLYGDRILFVPYVMPGFILARKIYELTQDANWEKLEGMILLNHGVFTFSDDAKEAYEKMIELVTEAENYIEKSGATKLAQVSASALVKDDFLKLSRLRKAVGSVFGQPVVAQLSESDLSKGFSSIPNISELATKGTLTPDHVIHTKPKPLVVGSDVAEDVKKFGQDYTKYFERNKIDGLKILDLAPRWAVWPEKGTISFGVTPKNARIVSDISRHTMQAVQWSQNLGGWNPLGEAKLFEVEYWELEQAKLKKSSSKPMLQGKVALVTGAASGIGKASVEHLVSLGAAVIALDINVETPKIFSAKNHSDNVLAQVCDVLNTSTLQASIENGIKKFGGIDIVVSNAGMFPPGKYIADLPDEEWDRSIALNLTSHERLIKLCVPYLKNGFDPTIVIVASKNVPAPGPGASAYSVAKAGLTQLARVAALELASDGIRVNVVHPDAVFDTAVWTQEVLENRAKHYGLTVEQYKRKNLLKTEITSKDVAELIGTLTGAAFSKTTGAQIPLDGGNDRVI